jgi:thioredoxin 1
MDTVGSGLVLVDVWAESCHPCVVLGPHMESIADENPDLTVVKLDASKARRLLMSLQVRGLPTVLLLHDGQEVARISEPNLTPEQLDEWLSMKLGQLPAKET